MKLLISLISLFVICTNLFSQDINGKLGSSGQFIIRDTTATFLSLSQTTGNLTLNRNLTLPVITAGSQIGSIFKGPDRFIHNYNATGTTGFNTFIGLASGNFTMSGAGDAASYNTAVGLSTLYSLTTGNKNSAFGVRSLFNNTTGSNNSAFGNQSLYLSTTGYDNSAFGHEVLNNNSSGNSNSAFGTMSLRFNTTGYENSAFGKQSMFANTTGYGNSAFGYGSLQSITTGTYNTAIGYQAGNLIFTGSNNIAIGYNAQVPSGTASNQVRIGDVNITYAGIQVAWTVTSDRKLKSNIANSNLGLGFISRLRPVSYTRSNDESRKTEYGFIAQEVEDVLKEYSDGNNGMISKDDQGTYSLRYNDLISPMVKAIQELKSENDVMKKENADLKDELVQLKSLQDKVTALEKMVNEIKVKDVRNAKLGEK
jgi:trimeric autotransporter adhesin